MIDMRMDSIKIRQLRVVAIDAAQMVIIIMWHRELIPFKHMLGQREDVFGKARIVVGNAHA